MAAVNRSDIRKRRIYVLVYKSNLKAIEDYVLSLKLFDVCIEFDNFVQFQHTFLNNNHYMVIMSQMWFSPPTECKFSNLIFLNVEHLTERNRINHVHRILYSKIPVADFSETNIKLLQPYADQHSVPVYHLPYQYELSEQTRLDTSVEFVYDVGIINANPKVDDNTCSKRTLIWKELIENNYNVCNIEGWREERDDLINQCRIILNVHHFESFTVFEHIRCDRLLFANKLVVSELSLDSNNLDIADAVIWVEYKEILPVINVILKNYDMFRTKYERSCAMKQIAIDRKLKLQDFVTIVESDSTTAS